MQIAAAAAAAVGALFDGEFNAFAGSGDVTSIGIGLSYSFLLDRLPTSLLASNRVCVFLSPLHVLA